MSAKPRLLIDLTTRDRVVAVALAIALVCSWVLAVVGNPVNWGSYWASIGMLALAVAAASLRAYDHIGRRVGSVPSGLAFLAAVGLLRAATVSSAGVTILALIPVFWSAMSDRARRTLPAAIAGLAAVLIVPIFAVGAPQYHVGNLRGALLTTLVVGVVAIVVARLVSLVRNEAERAAQARITLERVSEVAYTLFASDDVRGDLCRATVTIARAAGAVLLEPAPNGGGIRVTAEAGVARSLRETLIPDDAPISALFREGRQLLVNDVDPARLQMPELWEAGGSPSALLCQPLLRGDVAVGMLIVGWHDTLRIDGPRVAAIGLLTHEAATLLSHADRQARLAGMVATDPLTGLANRRAWDARARRSAAEPGMVTVAMLDLDHFKRFNDTHGHAAGDELLRETAAAWSGQLRPGDLLARLGGEEFGLMLFGGDEAAADMIERLRASVTHGQTCSAGVAQRRPGEPIAAVVDRADAALYAAKAAGRDLARAAV